MWDGVGALFTLKLSKRRSGCAYRRVVGMAAIFGRLGS